MDLLEFVEGAKWQKALSLRPQNLVSAFCGVCPTVGFICFVRGPWILERCQEIRCIIIIITQQLPAHTAVQSGM